MEQIIKQFLKGAFKEVVDDGINDIISDFLAKMMVNIQEAAVAEGTDEDKMAVISDGLNHVAKALEDNGLLPQLDDKAEIIGKLTSQIMASAEVTK